MLGTCSCSRLLATRLEKRPSLYLPIIKRKTCNKYFHRNFNTAAANAILSRSTQSSLHRLPSPFPAPPIFHSPLVSFTLQPLLRPPITKHGKCPTLASAAVPRPLCSHRQPSSRCRQYRTTCTSHRLAIRCGRRSMGCLRSYKSGIHLFPGKDLLNVSIKGREDGILTVGERRAS